MIRAEEFSFTYPVPGDLKEKAGASDFFSRRALDRISFSLDKGDFALITGESGSGKSTLLLALCGMIPHVTGGKIGGSLFIGEREIRTLNPSVLSETAGAAFQNPHTQLFTPTVREEVAFPLQNRGIFRVDMEKRIEENLAFVGLSGMEERKPRELSGGEKQRLLLAVLLAWDPPVYLLDEPLSALDPEGAREIQALLLRLNREQGKTIVLAEKERDRSEYGASRLFRMERGGLSEVNSPSPFSFSGNSGGSKKAFNPPEHPSLVLENVRFAYPGYPTLFENFSLTLEPGRTVCLTGANGSGKTTLASLMMGLLPMQRGALKFGEKDLTGLSIAGRSSCLGYLFQNPDYQLFNSTVREEISFGLDPDEETISGVLAEFGLTGYGDLPPALLSFALRKRVALASVYARDTPFVILDEPDWGQDRSGLEGIVRYVREGTARGKGFLLISHNPALVETLADREIRLGGEKRHD